MKKGIVILLALLSFAHAYAAGNPKAGEAKAKVCAACHGATGVSSNPEWPSLAGQGEKYLIKQLQNFKSGARPSMIMQPQASLLTDEDIINIAAYYSSQPAPENEAFAATEELQALVKVGEQIYLGGNMEKGIPACSACHGPTGKGVPPAGFPALAGQHAVYLQAQLKAFQTSALIDEQASTTDKTKLVLRGNDANNMMTDIAKKMTPREMEAVALYIQGLR
ncbi:MAG: c-type cytochrome [Cardiobacteriaceae bacterium]|nr:c-type cytochrome [Cardiobacteriaceae bacterium]